MQQYWVIITAVVWIQKGSLAATHWIQSTLVYQPGKKTLFFLFDRFVHISVNALHDGHKGCQSPKMFHKESDISSVCWFYDTAVETFFLFTIALPIENLDWINVTIEQMREILPARGNLSVSLTSRTMIFPEWSFFVYSWKNPSIVMKPASCVSHVSTIFANHLPASQIS